MTRRTGLDLTSMLFVPASRPKMIAKARTLAAPAVILDLEDGVGVGEKQLARETLVAALAEPWPSHPLLFVRTNGVRTPYFAEDVAAAASVGPVGVCVPKCESPEDVAEAAAALDRAGAAPDLALVPFVESAKGIVAAAQIAAESHRVVAVALGCEDLATEMGIRRTREGAELSYYRGVVATAAHAVGAIPIDGVFADFNDPEGLFADASVGRAAGFGGKQIIHPSQVEVVARAYAPSDAERAWAERVLGAFDAAEREGSGVVVVDGAMVDMPFVLRARRILGR